jgi:hypothetical protein
MPVGNFTLYELRGRVLERPFNNKVSREDDTNSIVPRNQFDVVSSKRNKSRVSKPYPFKLPEPTKYIPDFMITHQTPSKFQQRMLSPMETNTEETYFTPTKGAKIRKHLVDHITAGIGNMRK